MLLSIVFISFFLCILDFKKGNRKKNNNLYFWFFIFILIVVSSIKDENTSFDTSNYISSFNRIRSFSDFFSIQTFRYEPGYTFLEFLIKDIFDDYSVLFFIISFISLTLLGRIIQKYSPYPFVSLFIYITLFYFKRDIITIRYGISCIFMLAAIMSFINKEKIKSIVWMIISFLFHYTALSCMLFLLVYYLFLNRIRTLEIIILYAFPLAILGITILGVILKINEFLPPFFQYAINKGIAYLGEEDSAGFKQVILYIPFCFLIRYLHLLKSNCINGLYITLLFAMFMMIELNQVATFSRVNQMYLTSIIILVPLILRQIKLKKNFFILYSYTMILSIYMFIRITFFNSGGFINVYW